MMVLIGPLLAVLAFTQTSFSDFKTEQLNFPKVKEAFDLKEVDLKTRVALRGVDKENFEMYIRAFKLEEVVEVWARTKGEDTYAQIANFPFCSSVGVLGPKRKQGDRQIPEGFYEIEEFNPESDYHLSLKVSYPNKSDSILGDSVHLGGLIYIHGGCETIGCIPITDDKIMELYVLAVLAKDNGQERIPIHIFPARLNYSNYKMLVGQPEHKAHIRFWGSLRTCYLYFEERGALPLISTNQEGEYLFHEREPKN